MARRNLLLLMERLPPSQRKVLHPPVRMENRRKNASLSRNPLSNSVASLLRRPKRSQRREQQQQEEKKQLLKERKYLHQRKHLLKRNQQILERKGPRRL